VAFGEKLLTNRIKMGLKALERDAGLAEMIK